MTTISIPLSPPVFDNVYLRPQSLSEILTSSLALMRRHFWRLCGVFLVPTVPAHLLIIYGQEMDSILFRATGIIVLLAASMFVPPMLTVMIGDICRGMRPSLKRGLSLTCRRLPVIFVNGLLVLVIILSGCMLFIVPGVIALMQLMFVSQVSTLEENRWGVAAIRRSRQLASGYNWRSFRLLLIVTVVGFVLGLLSVPLHLLFQGPDLQWVDALIGNLFNGVSTIFGIICSVLLYYELRARKEGVTPDVLMQDLPAGF